MTTLRTAAEQALEALLLEATDPPLPETGAAIDALRAALEVPQGEPVALTEGFDAWWQYHRIKRVLTPDGVARMVWEASARHHRATAAPPQVQRPLTERELQLIDGMIEVQRHHADQCDRIANRVMAEKQKGWDMERVDLLLKLRASGITDTGAA